MCKIQPSVHHYCGEYISCKITKCNFATDEFLCDNFEKLPMSKKFPMRKRIKMKNCEECNKQEARFDYCVEKVNDTVDENLPDIKMYAYTKKEAMKKFSSL